MGIFGYLLRSSRWAFLAAVAASALSGASGASFIVVVNQSLTRVPRVPAALVWAYAGLCLTTVVTRFVAQTTLFALAQQVIVRLRRELIDAILAAPLRTVERTGTSRLYSALSDDVVVIADALPGLPALCSSAAFVAVALGYLAFVSPIAAIATLAATVLGVAVYRTFSVTGLRSLRAAREHQDRLFEHFRAVTGGVKELKLNRERRLVVAGTDVDETAAAYRRHSVAGLTVFDAAAGGGQAVFFLLIGIMLFLLPSHFAIAKATVTASVLVVLFAVSSLQSILVLLPPLGRASVALRTIGERLASLRIPDVEAAGVIEATARDGLPGPGAEPEPGFDDWSRIQFHDVTHRYPGPAGEEFTLGPLNLEFRRGEVLFVAGANGSGKTTLAKVLTGLYPPQGGTIWVDGRQVTESNRDAYRESFSAVFSDFFLFESLAWLPADDLAAKGRHYLERLQLDDKVRIADGRFSTLALSQGQRKRLALLASLLEDRSFYVFDEWAADQDPAFREFFYRELLAELKAGDRAVVVITHDDRYFGLADRLIRLDYGQIREDLGYGRSAEEGVTNGPNLAVGPGAEVVR
jgi:putative ATP-binding cassette transporter